MSKCPGWWSPACVCGRPFWTESALEKHRRRCPTHRAKLEADRLWVERALRRCFRTHAAS